MSLSEEPPVETITGFFVFAIFSIRIQSLQSELAILRIGDAELAAEIDRVLVEWGRHRNAAGFPDGLHQSWRNPRGCRRVSMVFLI